MAFFDTIVNLIYPGRRCPVCKNPAGDDGLCEHCRSGIILIQSGFCRVCGKPLPEPYADGCSYCGHGAHVFSAARAAGVYAGTLKRAVIALKYYGRKDVARPLGDLMHAALKSAGFEANVMVPVPLGRVRLKSRGYNQAELLARRVSKLSGIPVVNGLTRVRETESSTGLSRADRLRNLEGAFELHRGIGFKDMDVLVVDDTMTTGATADECAKVLLLSGARRVYLLTAATAVLRQGFTS